MSNTKNFGLKALLSLLFLSGSVIALLPTKQAWAAPFPLDPGCWQRVAFNDYEERDCPADNFDNLVDRGACFVTRSNTSTVFFEIDCDDTNVTLVGTHNTTRARQVCEAIEDPHFWSTVNSSCYYGPSCDTTGVDAGTGCTRATVNQLFDSYLQSQLNFSNPSSTPSPSPGSGGGGTGGGGTGGGGGGTVRPQDCPDGDVTQCGNAAPAAGGGGNSAVVQEDIGDDGQNLSADCKVSQSDPELTRENCKIIDYLVFGINLLSGIAGLAMVFSFIFAGYQYITARDNPQFVQSAKNRILWTVIALFTFIFMYGILNWLVPGGVLP